MKRYLLLGWPFAVLLAVGFAGGSELRITSGLGTFLFAIIAAACACCAVFGTIHARGFPADYQFLVNHAIYEVLNVYQAEGSRQDDKGSVWWLVLRHQNGDQLVYSWQGVPPVCSTSVKVRRVTAGSTNGGFVLDPYPPPAEKPKTDV
ncbi:MAG: hypothetical protein AAB364_03010 [Patescibacteria group bacterium]